MKPKVAIALIVLTTFATWFIAWELYDSFELWQTISSVKYQNYVFLGMIAECGLSILGLITINKPSPQMPRVKIREQVPSFARNNNPDDDPPDPPFIQLVARVNGIENEQLKMRKDIESIRNFAKLTGPQKEEEKLS